METEDIGEAFDAPSIIRGLASDLKALRAGEISTKEAQVRADIAKQIFNGLRLVLAGQRYVSAKAREVKSIDTKGDAGS